MFDSCDEGLFWAPAQRSGSTFALIRRRQHNFISLLRAALPGLNSLAMRPFSLFLFTLALCVDNITETQCIYARTHAHGFPCHNIYKKSRALEHISNVTLPRESKKKARRGTGFRVSCGACTWLDVRGGCKLFYCWVCTCRRRLLSKFNEFILNSSLAESIRGVFWTWQQPALLQTIWSAFPLACGFSFTSFSQFRQLQYPLKTFRWSWDRVSNWQFRFFCYILALNLNFNFFILGYQI